MPFFHAVPSYYPFILHFLRTYITVLLFTISILTYRFFLSRLPLLTSHSFSSSPFLLFHLTLHHPLFLCSVPFLVLVFSPTYEFFTLYLLPYTLHTTLPLPKRFLNFEIYRAFFLLHSYFFFVTFS